MISAQPQSDAQGTGNDSRLQWALVNHDLRSAVSDIIGGLRLVDHGGLSSETLVQLERVRTSAEQMARLLDDVLQAQETVHALGEAGAAAASVNLNLERYLSDLRLRWSGHAHERGLEFRLESDDDLPSVILTDRIALDRILTNALSNAMKFSADGTIVLSVSREEAGALVFAVSDQGSGFAEQALERLFERDSRPEDAPVAGNGLGLFISRQLADRMGGTLEAHNLRDGGALIRLSLPAANWQKSEAQGAGGGNCDLSDLKILVAEDNETLQLLACQMLRAMGAEYELATNGVEALEWLHRENFDLMLLDIEMPRMSGLDVMKTVRRMPPPLCHMPIVAMTAFALNCDRQTIYAAGADGLLAKPLPGAAAFGSAIRMHRDRALAKPAAEPLARTVLDRLRFDELLEQTPVERRAELLTRLRSDLKRSLNALTNVAGPNKRNDLRTTSHVLIAVTGAIGATRAYSAAQALNLSAHHDDCATVGQHRAEAIAALRELVPAIDGHLAAAGEAGR